MRNLKHRQNAPLIVAGLLSILACAKSPGEAGAYAPNNSSDAGNSTGTEGSTPQAEVANFNSWPSRANDQFELAKRYADGNGVEQDPYLAGRWAKDAALQGHDGALEWLRKRADEGDLAANLWLGIVYKYDSRHPEKHDEGLALLEAAEERIRALAEQGDPKAQNNLAIMYDFGHAVEEDPAKANEWYEKAAKQGYAPAQHNLGVSYHVGSGVTKDLKVAEHWYRRAVEQGHPAASANLAKILYHRNNEGGDFREALELFRQAAVRGNAEAQYSFAVMSQDGEGLPSDLNAALTWYQRAAEQGHHGAENNLGLMYKNGEGVSQDFAKAAELFKESALSGNPNGQANLAKLYRDGQGVERDLAKAQALFSLAAAQGAEGARREQERVERLAKCEAKAETQLFGVPIACATRAQLRNAIRSTGGTVKREKDSYWYDLYDAKNLLDGSNELRVGYTIAGDFAHAEYVFSSHMDRGQVDRIAALVESKYGPPQKTLGDSQLGEVTHTWKLEDGIVLTVRRGWPATTTFLEYTSPENKVIVDQEIAAEKNNEQSEAAERQSNAF